MELVERMLLYPAPVAYIRHRHHQDPHDPAAVCLDETDTPADERRLLLRLRATGLLLNRNDGIDFSSLTEPPKKV